MDKVTPALSNSSMSLNQVSSHLANTSDEDDDTIDWEAIEKVEREESQRQLNNTTLSGTTFIANKTANLTEDELREIQEVSQLGELIFDEEPKNNEPKVFGGFGFASGKPLPVAAKAMENAMKMFHNADLSITENILNKASTSVKKINEATTSKILSKIPGTFSGFGFASGKPLQVSAATMENAKRKFNEADLSIDLIKFENPPKKIKDQIATENIFEIEKAETQKVETKKSNEGFRFVSGKPLHLNAKLIEDARRKMQEDDVTSDISFKKPASVAFSGFGFASGKKLQISAEKLASAKRKMDEDDVTSEIAFKKIKPQVTPADQVPQNKNHRLFTPSHTSSPLTTTKSSQLKKLNRHMLNYDSDEEPSVSSEEHDEILAMERILVDMFDVADKIKELRLQELQKQRDYIENKPATDTTPLEGELFTMKKAHQKITLKESLGEFNMKKIPHAEIIKVKFNVEHLLKSKDDIFIALGDNVKLVIGDNFKVSFEEIKLAFLSSPGVDPKLLHENWFQNAYTMIALKLIWKGNYCQKNLFNAENILLQLKYRYDCEIDASKRSTLKQITELEEIPQRRMILKVHDIYFFKECGYELEVTDGWYKIRATVDKCIAEEIDLKNIEIDTNLVISNAILLSPTSDACDPLDTTNAIRLRLSGNSTRVAADDAKLGFCEEKLPFEISLNSVSGNGGTIAKLTLYVVHVYPLIYVIPDGDRKIHRSVRMQERVRLQEERINSKIFEKAFKEQFDEYIKQLKPEVKEYKKKPLEELSIQEICAVVECDGRRGWFYNSLSRFQKKEFERYHKELEERIRVKALEAINETKTSSLLKFRVVDQEDPQKTALIQWYDPSEDHLGVIKEGKFIAISSAFALTSSDEIFIYASNKIKLIPLPSTSSEKYQQFMRQETKITDLKESHQEIDIAAIVIKIDEPNSKGYQKVIVADDEQNFLIINFIPSLVEYALENFIKEKMIFMIRNLQWRNSFDKNIPVANAMVGITSFSLHPCQEVHRIRLAKFKERINDEYFEKCKELLEKL